MTEPIHYASLTWPEVDKLDRKIPVVFPLGNNGHPEYISDEPYILMPEIPYGWKQSGLEIETIPLAGVINTLSDCLWQDGFHNQVLISPEVPISGLTPNLRLVHDSQPGSAALNDLEFGSRERVVLIPVGHIEQHGYHLPLSVDTDIVDAICRETARRMPGQCISLPAMPYGVSTHRRDFPGTLNCGWRTFEDFMLAVVDALAGMGYTRMYFISGHGGNVSYLTNVVKAAGESYPKSFIATSWLYLSGPSGIEALEKYRETSIGGMGHACELETSLMLYLKPGMVHLEKAIDEIDFITTPSYYMDWIEGGALIANPPWTDDTRTGAYGAGSKATLEKGKIWFEAAVSEKVNHVLEIQEQYQRRLKVKK